LISKINILPVVSRILFKKFSKTLTLNKKSIFVTSFFPGALALLEKKIVYIFVSGPTVENKIS